MSMDFFPARRAGLLLLALATLLLAACAGPRIDWNSRLGQYTFDQAILELGPPDKDAVLSDGTRVAEWLTFRGSRYGTLTSFDGLMPGYYPYPYHSPWLHYHESASPDSFLRLSFDPEGRLIGWRRFMR